VSFILYNAEICPMWKIFSVPCGSALYKFHCIYNEIRRTVISPTFTRIDIIVTNISKGKIYSVRTHLLVKGNVRTIYISHFTPG
jgi:hypothetical protein